MRTLFCFLTSLPLLLTAQYSTPGTGVHWNLDSLVMHSGGVVTSDLSNYNINEDLTISENDSLTVLTYSMYLASDALLSIAGYTSISGFGPIVSSIDPLQPYQGIRIEEEGEALFDFVRFNGGGGIKSISGEVEFTHCEFHLVEHIQTNNGALEVSNGTVKVEECLFQECLGSAISSAANANCGIEIINSVFIGNNTENENRPQINLGASGADHTIYIYGNQITGNPSLDMVGGIATTSLLGVPSDIVIADNEIRDNRYGITVSGGGTESIIYGNVIEDNNTQGLPLLGGSGINFNGNASNHAEVEENEIRGNLWGITVQGAFSVDMGIEGSKTGSAGLNTFSDNGNEGQVYALFNNTLNPINAQNNCWIEGQESTAEQVEAVISHQVDDPELGPVDFSMFNCPSPDGVNNLESASFSIYPNPSQDYIMLIDLPSQHPISYSIYNTLGELIAPPTNINGYEIDIRTLSSGQYILEVQDSGYQLRQSFIKY